AMTSLIAAPSCWVAQSCCWVAPSRCWVGRGGACGWPARSHDPGGARVRRCCLQPGPQPVQRSVLGGDPELCTFVHAPCLAERPRTVVDGTLPAEDVHLPPGPAPRRPQRQRDHLVEVEVVSGVGGDAGGPALALEQGALEGADPVAESAQPPEEQHEESHGDDRHHDEHAPRSWPRLPQLSCVSAAASAVVVGSTTMVISSWSTERKPPLTSSSRASPSSGRTRTAPGRSTVSTGW